MTPSGEITSASDIKVWNEEKETPHYGTPTGTSKSKLDRVARLNRELGDGPVDTSAKFKNLDVGTTTEPKHVNLPNNSD